MVQPYFGSEIEQTVSGIGAKEFANRKLIVTMPTDAPITDALG